MFRYLIIINLLMLASCPELQQGENIDQKKENIDQSAENTAQTEENAPEKEETPNQKENPEVRTGIPVVISHYKKAYHLPYKAYITTSSQRQEFYYHEEKDGKYYCPLSDTEETKDPNQENNNEIKDVKYLKYQYCLIETTFPKKEAKRCKGEVKPIIVEKTKIKPKGEIEFCGGESRIKYKFGYQVCVKKSTMRTLLRFWKKYTLLDTLSDIQHPHTYEICYDHSQNQVIYTEHKIMSPYIFRNLRLEKELALHDFSQTHSTETYGLKNLNKLQITFDAYLSQPTLDGYYRAYELKTLTPITDFALGHWKKTTYHLINFSPQYLFMSAFWGTINTQVFNKIVYDKKNPDIKIFAGTWDILVNADDEKIYLGEEKFKITIPKYWWKVVHDSDGNRATAIIMHNADFSDRICESRIDVCDIRKWNRDLEKSLSGNVYCCDVQSASKTIKTIEGLGIIPQDDTKKLELFNLN